MQVFGGVAQQKKKKSFSLCALFSPKLLAGIFFFLLAQKQSFTQECVLIQSIPHLQSSDFIQTSSLEESCIFFRNEKKHLIPFQYYYYYYEMRTSNKLKM
jgi:hypothetical protein